jgi:4-hydroxythreonine-4-phosphate dehydrogenase
MSKEYKPLLVITMGDASGSGPEIIAKALAEPGINAICRPVVVGDATTMQDVLKITGVKGKIKSVKKLADASFSDDIIHVIDLHNIRLVQLKRGQVDIMAGKAAYDYIKLATELTLSGEADAIVTSAISKEALNLAGYQYDGHTELLAELCGVQDVAMMLVSDKLRVIHVTTHVSLSGAIKLIRPKRILTTLKLAHEAIKQMGVKAPLMAVAGLNPHAGENGLFGDEETKYIVPALEAAQHKGINAIGPLPPDSVFFRAAAGEFDGVIAMYHDQGHIAVKMLGVTRGVNVTLGLPIIRTSVDHGTAFDKAGKGTADPGSLIESIKLAAVMSQNRRRLIVAAT